MAVWLTAEVTESDVNIEANTSKVTVKLYANWNWSSYNALSPSGSISIDGTEYPFQSSFNEGQASTGSQLIATKSKTVTHEADGSKNVHLSAWYATQVSSGTVTWNLWKDLTTIPRASQPSLQDSSPTMGDTIAIYTNPASDTFTHTLKYSFNGREATIAEGVKASTYWEVTTNLALAIPNATSGTGSIVCETYSADGTLVGTKSAAFTATVPDDVVPVIDSVTVGDLETAVSVQFAAYVQGKSRLQVVTAARGLLGSSIARITVEAQGELYTGEVVEGIVPLTAGTLPVTVTVRDSRGRTASKAANVAVLAYSDPSITSFEASRCTADGTYSEEGACALVHLGYALSPVGDRNESAYRLYVKRADEEAWPTSPAVEGSGYSVDADVLLPGPYSVDYTYDLRVEVDDWFAQASATARLHTAFTLVDYRGTGRGISFGKVSEMDAFECALPAKFTGGFVGAEDRAAELLNGWEVLSGAYKAPSYALDPVGWVRLSGAARGGQVAEGTPIFILPEGFRPDYAERFTAVTAGGLCAVDVLPTGSVQVAHGVVSTFLSLSGVAFRVSAAALTADEGEV